MPVSFSVRSSGGGIEGALDRVRAREADEGAGDSPEVGCRASLADTKYRAPKKLDVAATVTGEICREAGDDVAGGVGSCSGAPCVHTADA